MKSLKKYLLLSLVLVLTIVTTCACGKSKKDDKKDEKDKKSEVKIATGAPDFKQMDNDKILQYFNNIANSAKIESKSITKNFTHTNINENDISISGASFFLDMVKSAIVDNVKKANEEEAVTSEGDEKNNTFPVRGESWASKLEPQMIGNLTYKEEGDYYHLMFDVLNDDVENPNAGDGNCGKCMPLIYVTDVTKQDDRAKNIKLKYTNCQIVCSVNKKTGKLTAINYKEHVDFSLEYSGVTISSPYDLECDYTINW